MHYFKYFPEDYVNGEGQRVSLFLSGCDLQCKGCFNKKAWSPTSGTKVSLGFYNKLLADLKDSDGLSLLGGEPLDEAKAYQVTALLAIVKQSYPDKDIWVWTGHTFDEVKDHPALKHIDVLIDGRFDIDQPTVKAWRGSDNQRLLRLEGGKVTSIE
ncbi:anaerobic ribonucleoside-triphosphate reductase activating protein [Vibrio sp. SCSIO 43137]|uniref:anaerobic ribonucleoside-triphosphate reductase activating protein n=1 Tax=Vibrio sp. SCSIO 43137 TaxID=3021011 RepID=UPI002307A051|nr:anaerobic ribonucleoside-triphosphate reductase activating protein [Vibrio sp. SCSIO 43137]WCE28425.1 anaerobic ribonucleoside-triphosphate reductase activating protein [Vibrio sp. SCSIO 43137]